MAEISKIKLPNNATYNLRDDVHTWGGRNLVWNSSFIQGSTVSWNNWGNPTTREIVYINGKYYMHIVGTTARWQGYSQNSQTRNLVSYDAIKPGDVLTFSFEAYAKTAGQTACIGVHWLNSEGSIVSQSWWAPAMATTSKRYVLGTATVPDNVTDFNIMVGDNTTSVQELWITNIKAERGNKATDWSPAPEDIAQVDDTELILLS